MDKKKIGFGVGFLILLDQFIKIIINNNFLSVTVPIIPPFVYFEPMFNRHYSWINGLFDLGVGRIAHILLVIVILIFLHLFYKYLNTQLNSSKALDISYILIISGAICSLIDKVVWNGSLDYIYLKGLFTFDLKDVYISLYVAIIIFAIIFKADYFENLEDDLFSDFVRYLKKDK